MQSRIQDQLKGKLVLRDDFTWTIPSSIFDPMEDTERVKADSTCLRYIGGVDVSFVKGNTSIACGALVILDAYTFQVVYEDYNVAQLDIPYIPGFLAFREVCFHIPSLLDFTTPFSSFLGLQC